MTTTLTNQGNVLAEMVDSAMALSNDALIGLALKRIHNCVNKINSYHKNIWVYVHYPDCDRENFIVNNYILQNILKLDKSCRANDIYQKKHIFFDLFDKDYKDKTGKISSNSVGLVTADNIQFQTVRHSINRGESISVVVQIPLREILSERFYNSFTKT